MRLKIPDRVISPKLVKLKKRTQPLDLGIKSLYTTEVTVELPKNRKAIYIPNTYSVDGGCFTVTRENKSSKEIRIKTIYRKECTIITPENYTEFRNSALKVISQQNDHVEIEKIE